jgi:hypothetical protein
MFLSSPSTCRAKSCSEICSLFSPSLSTHVLSSHSTCRGTFCSEICSLFSPSCLLMFLSSHSTSLVRPRSCCCCCSLDF